MMRCKKRDESKRLFPYLELSSLFKLHHITLALERAARSQEHILVTLVNVLRPGCQPGNSVVVLNSFPLSRHVGYGYRSLLADVKDDILRSDTILSTTLNSRLQSSKACHLEGTFLWVFTTTSEQTRRLNSEIPNFLFAPIEHASDVLELHVVLGFLQFLFLSGRQRFLLCLFRLEVIKHGTEITLLEACYLDATQLRKM